MKLKTMLIGVLALGCACAFGGETKENAVAQKLQTCDFLLNKDFKKNAKYYLCIFSASWCGPCRREMPRIAKTYVPAVVSRTVTLSDQNPCLFIKVASHNEEADFLLSVRVNGQTALPTRLICTPDFEPWQVLARGLAVPDRTIHDSSDTGRHQGDADRAECV